MVDKYELRHQLLICGVSYKEAAKDLGITLNAFSRKVNNITEFKASEIMKLYKLLKLDSYDIFFTDASEYNSRYRR